MSGTPPTFLSRILSILTAAQCAGLVLYVSRDSSAVGSVLFVHLEVGEAWSVGVDRAAAQLALAIAVTAVAGWPNRGLLFVSGWFALLALAQTYDGGVPFAMLSLPAHATRIALPIAALLAARLESGRSHGLDPEGWRWGVRVAIALTFATHGYEALAGHPRFIDYILTADEKLFSAFPEQPDALRLMLVIGILDLGVACLILTGRDTRWLLAYAACWGVLTAIARVVHVEQRYPQALIRVANGGLPLVLLFSRSGFAAAGTPQGLRRRVHGGLRSVLAALCLGWMVGLLYTIGASFEVEASDATPTQLRLVWGERPGSEVTVAWSTGVRGQRHEILYDTQRHEGAQRPIASAMARIAMVATTRAPASTTTRYWKVSAPPRPIASSWSVMARCRVSTIS